MNAGKITEFLMGIILLALYFVLFIFGSIIVNILSDTSTLMRIFTVLTFPPLLAIFVFAVHILAKDYLS